MAIEPRILAKNMHIKKAFKSKKIPLWLQCDAYEWQSSQPFPIFFKAGDDLR
jgi:hypothetical protein